jgi:hypothetical protein
VSDEKPVAYADDSICNALPYEMRRIDHLRMRLDLNNPDNLWIEFMMRRAILRARFALHQRNRVEALRMWKVLRRYGNRDT